MIEFHFHCMNTCWYNNNGDVSQEFDRWWPEQKKQCI